MSSTSIWVFRKSKYCKESSKSTTDATSPAEIWDKLGQYIDIRVLYRNDAQLDKGISCRFEAGNEILASKRIWTVDSVAVVSPGRRRGGFGGAPGERTVAFVCKAPKVLAELEGL